MQQMNSSIGRIRVVMFIFLASQWMNGEAAEVAPDPAIELGTPVVVSQAPVGVKNWGPWQFPAIQRMPDGQLQIGFHVEADSATAYGARPGVAISDDNGVTWREAADLRFPPSWTSKNLMLPNGDRLIQLPRKSLKLEDVQDKLPKPLTAWTGGYAEEVTLFAGKDMPSELVGWRFVRLARGSVEWVEETAKVNIPGEIRNATNGVLTFPWIHRIKLAPDGALWGFGHSMRMVDGELQKKLVVQFLRSEDSGRTWNLLNEIPYQPDKNADKLWDKRQGFTEPEIGFLPNGSMLCLMRTHDGNGVGPLYQSRSTDNGKTWSKPTVFDEIGVWPTLLTLENGSTLVSYGRPGLYVRASNDPAAEMWGPKVAVVPPGPLGGDTCSYSDLIALDDRTALIAYSDFTFPDEQGRPRKTILVRKVTVADRP